MSLYRKLLLALVVTSLLIVNGGIGAAIESTLMGDDNTTQPYIALDFFDEDSVSDFNASSTNLVYSTFTSVPPTIDGSLSYDEWGKPAIIDTLRYSNDSINYETHDMYVYFKNDNNYLYIAAKIINDDFESDETYVEEKGMDHFIIYFDGDNDEIFEFDDDSKKYTNLVYEDWHNTGDDLWIQDTILDGEGVASHSNQVIGDYTYEFKIPLNSGDANDFAITSNSTIGLKIEYFEYYYDSTNEYWTCDGKYDGWPNGTIHFDGVNFGKLKLSPSPDTEAPNVAIISPINGTIVTTSRITITGTATDDTGITSLTLNGNPITLESDSSFTTTIPLNSGLNTITVAATDAASNTATQCITVNYTFTSVTGELNLTLVGNHHRPGNGRGFALSNNYACVATDNKGLIIVNVSNPAKPALAGSYATPGHATDVAVSGNYAYVADGKNSGLVIIDISNPKKPVLAGSYDTPGHATDVAVSGNYAYVADFDNGLVIIDISNPAEPVLAGSYYMAGSAKGVVVSGNYAYVAYGSRGLAIINISNLIEPVLVGSYDTSGFAQSVAVSDNYAYVADFGDGLAIINISNPTEPVLVSSYNATQYTTDIAVSDNYAYVSTLFNGLAIIDISNLAAPMLASSYNTSGNAWSVAVSGSYVYGVDSYDGLVILHTDTPVTSMVGDLNGNSILDTSDVALALRMAVGLTTPDLRGDTNGNGIIDFGDAILMIRTIVGLE